MPPDAADFVDTESYPIDRPGSPSYAAMIAGVRAELGEDGCALLAGFVRTDRVGALAAEADRVAPLAHRSFNRTNAYFSEDDPALPASHPLRRFRDRSNAFVPADNFGTASPLRAIYQWAPFMPFIRDALGEAEIHRYADPLADVIINVVEPGGGFPWHFDTNDYTVTLAIQNADAGGLFEYRPNLRTAEDENYAGVAAILDGGRDGVRSLALGPGDLQIFKGRFALHRVSPTEGARPRYVGINSFVDAPGMVGRVERTRQLYGRVLPIHRDHDRAQRADGLRD